MFRNSNITRNLVGIAGGFLLITLSACGGSNTMAPAEAPQEEVIHIEVAKESEEYATEAMPVPTGTPPLAADGEAIPNDEPSEEYVSEEYAAEAMPVPTGTPPLAAGGEAIPNDEPYDLMFFDGEGVNPFVDTEDDHLSTFAMDVDTASYTVARRYITGGHLPPPDAIRVEEFINYFDMNYSGPDKDEGAFAIHLEGAPSHFGPRNAYLLKVDLQGKRILAEDRKDANLVFVIDVSGSMNRENRLGLVKRSLRLLVDELKPADSVGIVIYGSQAQVILEPTNAEDPQTILAAIDRLQPGGSTNAEEGLRLGYRMAANAYLPGGINRVILLSDGVANVGRTGPDSILQVIRDQVAQGVTLSTVGVGMGNYNDVLMEQLANDGNGNYAYVDSLEEARRIFVENLTGTLQVIAKDAKIQVDFNPTLVRSYRLLGYENRAVADNDFRNDRVDAGEVGAGHSVTALYEIKFHPAAEDRFSDEAITVQVRYQDIDSGQVIELAEPFAYTNFQSDFFYASPEFRFIAAVAEYAEILRESYWAQDSRLEDVRALAFSVESAFANNNDAAEFLTLLERAVQLTSDEMNP